MQCYASVKTSTQLYNVHRLSNKVNYMLWAIVFILAVVFIIWDLPESSNKPCQGMHTLWSVQVCRPLSLSIYISTCFFSNQMKSTQCYNHGFSYIHIQREGLSYVKNWNGLPVGWVWKSSVQPSKTTSSSTATVFISCFRSCHPGYGLYACMQGCSWGLLGCTSGPC